MPPRDRPKPLKLRGRAVAPGPEPEPPRSRADAPPREAIAAAPTPPYVPRETAPPEGAYGSPEAVALLDRIAFLVGRRELVVEPELLALARAYGKVRAATVKEV